MIELVEDKVDMSIHFGQRSNYCFVPKIDEKDLTRAIITYSIKGAISGPFCNVKTAD